MLKIALAQIPIIAGHPDKNTETMLRYIEMAQTKGMDLILFPELSISGGLLDDTWEQPSFIEACIACGKEIIAASKQIIVLFGNVAVDPTKRNDNGSVRKYNAVFASQNGALLVPPRMPYPFFVNPLFSHYRGFDPLRYFFSLQQLSQELEQSPEDLLAPITFSVHGKNYTTGYIFSLDRNFSAANPHVETGSSILKPKASADFFIHISATPYAWEEAAPRHQFLSTQAAKMSTPIFSINHIGIQNNGKTIYTFNGASTIYDRKGMIRAAAPAYEEALLTVSLAEMEQEPALPINSPQESEGIFQALTYGIRQFLRTINMQRIVIGVSGGVDSAVAAALYCHVISPENLLLINMPSRFNSNMTKDLAAVLAKNLGCRYAIIPIQEAVALTCQQIENTTIQNPLSNKSEHLTLSSWAIENIQARDRSSRILAAAAAAFGGGFTCNANKTEITVGYSTLYGDQSGFLAALADLWKYQVYELAQYLNQVVYKREVIPLATLTIPPCAELSAAQNIEEGKGDPLHYPYHDFLFRAFCERRPIVSPQELLEWYAKGTLAAEIGCSPELIEHYFPSPQSFISDLERWWNLFSGLAAGKRIQSPPVIAISQCAYGADRREGQNGAYYTKKYRALKARLLNDS